MGPEKIAVLLIAVVLACLGLAALAVGKERSWERRKQRVAARLRSLTGSGGLPAVQAPTEQLGPWLELTEVLGVAAADPEDQGWALELLEGTMVGRLRERAWLALESLGRRDPGAASADRRRWRLLGNLLILQQSPAPELLEPLVPWLLEPDPAVAGAAALAIGHHPGCYDGAAVPAATALREAPPRSFQALAWCLTRLLEQHPSLVVVLADDPAPAVRRLALRAAERHLDRVAGDGLAERSGEEHAAALAATVEGAVGDPDGAVRREAVAAARHLDRRRRRRLCSPALTDPDPAVRRAAVRTLAVAGEDSAALLVATLPGAEAELRREILDRLEEARVGVPAAVRTQAERGTPEQRRWAVEALGALGGGPEVARLAAFLDDHDRDVRAAASRALAAVARRRDARPALRAALPAMLEGWQREDDPRAILALADALIRTGAAAAETAILTRLSSVAAPVRERLLEVLASFERAAAGRPDPGTP